MIVLAALVFTAHDGRIVNCHDALPQGAGSSWAAAPSPARHGVVITLALALAFMIWIRLQAHRISGRFEFPLPQTWTLARSWWSAVWTGPHLDLASFDRDGKADSKAAGTAIEIVTLWQNYLRATRCREMAGWILSSMLFVGVLSFASVLYSRQAVVSASRPARRDAA
jgi:hypothetical protein